MKKFIEKLLLFSIPLILFFIGIGIYNFWLDPFGVLKGDMTKQKTEPNQHYLKIKHCVDNPQKYNSFLFGSSKVGKIDISKISDTNNWYNFAYSECIPAEIFEDIKILLRNDVKINKILIGLEESSYLVSPDLHENQSLRKPFKNIVNPYLYYLFLKPSYSMYKIINKADTNKFYSEGAYKVIYTTGSFLANKKDSFIEQYPNIHTKNHSFTQPYWQPYYKKRIDETIKEISEIVKLCRNYKIEVIFFLNPTYKETYLKAVSQDYFLFMKKLCSVIQFYDFSGINEITTNKLNFYESSHYRPIVGDKIIQTLFTPKMRSQIIINKNNIDSIIKSKQIEYFETR